MAGLLSASAPSQVRASTAGWCRPRPSRSISRSHGLRPERVLAAAQQGHRHHPVRTRRLEGLHRRLDVHHRIFWLGTSAAIFGAWLERTTPRFALPRGTLGFPQTIRHDAEESAANIARRFCQRMSLDCGEGRPALYPESATKVSGGDSTGFREGSAIRLNWASVFKSAAVGTPPIPYAYSRRLASMPSPPTCR